MFAQIRAFHLQFGQPFIQRINISIWHVACLTLKLIVKKIIKAIYLVSQCEHVKHVWMDLVRHCRQRRQHCLQRKAVREAQTAIKVGQRNAAFRSCFLQQHVDRQMGSTCKEGSRVLGIALAEDEKHLTGWRRIREGIPFWKFSFGKQAGRITYYQMPGVTRLEEAPMGFSAYRQQKCLQPD